MRVVIITFCLIGAAFANPIFHSVLVSSELDSNSTESLSVLESSENSTSEIQSSEENISNQSSESESVESTSEDKTSEESDSDSEESNEMDSMPETKDDSMGSEENVRKQSWVRVFPGLVKGLSIEADASTGVKGQAEYLNNELTDKQPTQTFSKTVQVRTNQPLVDANTDSSDSADTSDSTDVTAATSNSSESISTESPESEETSNSSESSDVSRSTESSDTSNSIELAQIHTKDCVNGTQSCESEEYFLQSIGDDAHLSVDSLMLPDEDDGELRLRR